MDLATLQEYLNIGTINDFDANLRLVGGVTAFCTSPLVTTIRRGHNLWHAIYSVRKQEDKEKHIRDCDIEYLVQKENGEKVWVNARYFWTKEDVEQAVKEIPIHGSSVFMNFHIDYLPRRIRSDTNVLLPEGVEVKDPQAVVQAVLNLLRDATVRGRAGYTNFAAVKCDVDGLTLGHFYKIGEALGDDVCQYLERIRR